MFLPWCYGHKATSLKQCHFHISSYYYSFFPFSSLMHLKLNQSMCIWFVTQIAAMLHSSTEMKCVIYRLITAYSLLRVNLDKIMHARWNFDASSARTQRVSALDKHQNWSASALFCLNSRAQSKYAVVNLIHTRRKKTFCYVINKTF